MPDYIYLLENRLSLAQQNAMEQVRDAARDAGMTVFLAGGAVRDLTTGTTVRDLDFTVQGNALKLKKALEKHGAVLWGEYEPTRTLFFWFPGSVRVEVSSARSEEYPKPGKPVYHWAPILEDLRRRDFTANAMAISLNEGSYGLLLDPLNGMADIEARQLRLVSPYGFIEDPSRLLRAVRLRTRLGWVLEERTQSRYENAKSDDVIESISSYLKGYELEEIGHEEDGLRALRALETDGWMNIFPAWTASRADLHGLEHLHDNYYQLLMQGVHPDLSAAQMELLTAKMQPKDISALKKSFARHGFVEQWNHLESGAKKFAAHFTGKEAATPSGTWKLLTSYQPEPILWLAHTGKGAAIQNKFKNFFTVWPEARQKIPAALMQEMRITPGIERYNELLQELFFHLIDGKLQTDEAMRAFLEPYSPPAPPPPVTIRRSRKKLVEPKIKSEKISDEEGEEVEVPGIDDMDLDAEDMEEAEEEEAAEAPAKAKAAPKAPAKPEPEKKAADKRGRAPAAKAAPVKPAKKEAAKPAKAALVKKAKPAHASKPVAKKKAAKPAAKMPARKAAKSAPKLVAKRPAAKPGKANKKKR